MFKKNICSIVYLSHAKKWTELSKLEKKYFIKNVERRINKIKGTRFEWDSEKENMIIHMSNDIQLILVKLILNKFDKELLAF